VREENFRASPNGVLLGTLASGTHLRRLGEEDDWVEAEVAGWVWTRSMQIVDRNGFDLVISADGGENLRARPQGPVTGRLAEGTLLKEEERVPGWVRVRRRGWIWKPSVREVTPATAGPGDTPTDGPGGAEDAGEGGARPVGGSPPTGGFRGVALLSGPDGDTLAHLRSDGGLSVEEREGAWARVRLEGWIQLPDSTAADPGPARVGPTRVAAEPARWRGRIVTWDLQFVSVEEAEAIRTDFREGERFLLTRSLGERDAPFVYVALPSGAESPGVELSPLERITVTGRIRTGASVLTGSPILDLMELRRGSGR
jgi:hypothetical protein